MEAEKTPAYGEISSSSSFTTEYLQSRAGFLKIIEIFFGLICWSLIAASGWCGELSVYQFVLFVSVTSWLMTIISICIFLFGIPSGIGASLPWLMIEFGFNAFWALFYFIAACVQSAYTCGSYSYLVVASIFAYFTTVAYISHANLAFREWKGHFPWESSDNSGTNVPA